MKRTHPAFSVFCVGLAVIFSLTGAAPLSAQNFSAADTAGVSLSAGRVFTPLLLKGLRVNADDAFQFEFLVDQGDADFNTESLQEESMKMVRYFLASLAIPEEDLWVNLSPYEKDRIIPEAFGRTEMGRDLLAQDYVLKQLTASLMNPENEAGEKFWERVYEAVYQNLNSPQPPLSQRGGVNRDEQAFPPFNERGGERSSGEFTDDLIESFNKVWIVPERGYFYEHDNRVFISDAKLKVMLESDYLARVNGGRLMVDVQNFSTTNDQPPSTNDDIKQIIRSAIIPIIETEVNNGELFANLRQIYNAQLLAVWFKKRLKEHVLGRVYADTSGVDGIDLAEEGVIGRIWEQYVQAFRSGSANVIREEYDPVTQSIVPRKYFTGGARLMSRDLALLDQSAERARAIQSGFSGPLSFLKIKVGDNAMMTTGWEDFESVIGHLKEYRGPAREILGKDWEKDLRNLFLGTEGDWENFTKKFPVRRNVEEAKEIIREIKALSDKRKAEAASRANKQRRKVMQFSGPRDEAAPFWKNWQEPGKSLVRERRADRLEKSEVLSIMEFFKLKPTAWLSTIDLFEAKLRKVMKKGILPSHLDVQRLYMVMKFMCYYRPDTPVDKVLEEFESFEQYFDDNKRIESSVEKEAKQKKTSLQIIHYLSRKYNVEFTEKKENFRSWVSHHKSSEGKWVEVKETMEELELRFVKPSLHTGMILHSLGNNKILPLGMKVKRENQGYVAFESVEIDKQILVKKLIARIEENHEYTLAVLGDLYEEKLRDLFLNLKEPNLRALLTYRSSEAFIDDVKNYLDFSEGNSVWSDVKILQEYASSVLGLPYEAKKKEKLYLRRMMFDPETEDWSSRELASVYQLSFKEAVNILERRKARFDKESSQAPEAKKTEMTPAEILRNSLLEYEKVVLPFSIEEVSTRTGLSKDSLRRMAKAQGKVFKGTIEEWGYKNRGTKISEEKAKEKAREFNSQVSIFEGSFQEDFRIHLIKDFGNRGGGFSGFGLWGDEPIISMAMLHIPVALFRTASDIAGRKGGVDLRTDKADIRIFESENGFRFPDADPAMLQKMDFKPVPVFIEMQPVLPQKVSQMLGLNTEAEKSDDSVDDTVKSAGDFPRYLARRLSRCLVWAV